MTCREHFKNAFSIYEIKVVFALSPRVLLPHLEFASGAFRLNRVPPPIMVSVSSCAIACESLL